MMKKILLLSALCLALTSCAQAEEEPKKDYELTEQDQSIYNSIMQTELQYYNWSYNSDDIRFGVSIPSLPSDMNSSRLKEISESMGYPIDDWEDGEKTATAAVDIFHPNGDLGGNARFFFKNSRIICAYYTYNNNVYSLSDTSVFLEEGILTQYENLSTEDVEYNKAEIEVPFSHFRDVSPKSGIAAQIENGVIKFYTLRTNAFELSKSYSYGDLGYTPLDISFNNDGSCAILAGTVDEAGNKTSQKIIFLDNLLNPDTSRDFPLYVGSFHSILYRNNSVILAADTSVSEINIQTRENTANKSLIHGVSSIAACDIYNNGTMVYFITDKTNLFVYSSDFTLIWRTYNSEPSMDTAIYTADLNSDGTKEVYIKNTVAGCTYKYAVAKTGFMCIPVLNEIYLPGDFDANGRSEYISLSAAGTCLYTQKP